MKLHHVAVVCHSREKADRFYHHLLGLRRIKEWTADQELMEQIFADPQQCNIMLYGNEHVCLEVFVPESVTVRSQTFTHICLGVSDREIIASACQAEGLKVNRVARKDSELMFIEDYDGNLFEIKKAVFP